MRNARNSEASFSNCIMAVNPNRPPLVAVDTNVLFDLAGKVEDVLDSVSLLRERLLESRLLLPPTVQQELANWALRGETAEKRNAATRAVREARQWHIVPATLIAFSLPSPYLPAEPNAGVGPKPFSGPWRQTHGRSRLLHC